jgi:hypothetical protein
MDATACVLVAFSRLLPHPLFGRYRRHSGHRSALALNASVANDPKRTLAAHWGSGFDADFNPYQSTRLNRDDPRPETGGFPWN